MTRRHIAAQHSLKIILDKVKVLNETSAYCVGCGHEHDEQHKKDCLITGDEWWEKNGIGDRVQGLCLILEDA